MRMTDKQMTIMKVVMTGNVDEDGTTISWCDIHEVRERLPYSASREAVMCSLKFLERKGMVEVRPRAEVRDGRRRTLYLPTNLAFDVLTPPGIRLEDLLAANF